VLTSDGLSLAQFLPLWRDAMWSGDAMERARLLLELGRLTLREDGKITPLLVAAVEGREPPFALMPLMEPPRREEHALRDAVRDRLGSLGATEVYALMATPGGVHDGTPSFVLGTWGETLAGEQVAWVMPFRWTDGVLEEAPPLHVPDARATVFSRELSGLLVARH